MGKNVQMSLLTALYEFTSDGSLEDRGTISVKLLSLVAIALGKYFFTTKKRVLLVVLSNDILVHQENVRSPYIDVGTVYVTYEHLTPLEFTLCYVHSSR